MADELVGATFKIVSIDEDLPIGVNLTLPGAQVVYAGAPVNTWKIEKVGDEGTYYLSVGGYQYVGVNGNGDVVASIDPENPVPIKWRIVRSPERIGFSIEVADNIRPARVWATSGDGRPVRIRASEFPGVLPSELFLLKRCE